MIQGSLIARPGLAVIMAFAGVIFGVWYFAVLKRNVALLAGGRGWIGPLALTLGRVGGAIIFLLAAARLGAAPLLAALVGFLIARALAQRPERRAG